MKLLVVAALAAATAPVIAQPHHHAHRHLRRAIEKREPAEAAVYLPGPTETVVVYELNGQLIPEEEVRQGIVNGTLVWGDDGALSTSIFIPIVTETPRPAPLSQPEPTPTEQTVTDSSTVQAAPSSTAQPEPEPEPEPQPEPSTEPSSPPGQPSEHDGPCPDCEKEFPNGKYSCDAFPTGYGAVPLQNEGLGGWIGIQDPQYRQADGLDDIMTVPSGTCMDGTCCTPGRYCSYGCPNPYLKASFPKMQGKTKQSVGGLYCNQDNKLEMADGSLANTLCKKGSEHVLVKVQNKLDQPVSICRTDYPGTESMTIPLTVQPGETAELANPNQGGYYFWDGNPTSAQYYINNKGVPEKEACTWGTAAKTAGNWAPLNFGTSWDDLTMNMGFSGLAPNNPTTDAKLDFTITFEGDGVQNKCRFDGVKQEYCQGPTNDYSNCENGAGCTAAIKDGSILTLIFSD